MYGTNRGEAPQNVPCQFPRLRKCNLCFQSSYSSHSSNIIGELLYYVKNCEDDYVRSRMLDTVGWSCQTYNTFDREYDFGKKGWMSERFCYSEGLVYETYSDGSLATTWFCLMPWAIGSILDGLVGDYWDSI